MGRSSSTGGTELPYGGVGLALRPVLYHFTLEGGSDHAGGTAT